MKKEMQENKQAVTADDFIHQWLPYITSGAVFIPLLIAAIIQENIWLAFSGQLIAILVFFIVRMAFPRPGDSQGAN